MLAGGVREISDTALLVFGRDQALDFGFPDILGSGRSNPSSATSIEIEGSVL
jgi:hypothetical protein